MQVLRSNKLPLSHTCIVQLTQLKHMGCQEIMGKCHKKYPHKGIANYQIVCSFISLDFSSSPREATYVLRVLLCPA